MKDRMMVDNNFTDVPRTARGHFLMNLHAAVFQLVHHIYRVSDTESKKPEEALEAYPFLGAYFSEIVKNMPKDMTWATALRWWEHEIVRWETSGSEHFPLLALIEAGNYDFCGRMVLMLVGLVEEDSRFGTLFAGLQEPLGYRRPCVELLGQILSSDEEQTVDPWQLIQPLISQGLIEVANRGAPRSEWELQIPQVLWDAMKGEITTKPASGWQYINSASFPKLEELVLPDRVRLQMNNIPGLAQNGSIEMIVLRSTAGGDSLKIAGALARKMGRSVIEVDITNQGHNEFQRILGPLSTLVGAQPVLHCDLNPGETALVPIISAYNGPVTVLIGPEGGIQSRSLEKAINLTLPFPTDSERRIIWRQAFNGHPVEDLAEISTALQIPRGYIHRIAPMAISNAALDNRSSVQLKDVRSASRLLNRQLLDTLADHVAVEGKWCDFVASPATEQKLRELEQRCRHREVLYRHLGPAYGGGANRGVRALFAGASGTGKTLAAKILASEIGLDLCRVDLAAVVNKYIGETEKNLHRVLSRAEELDVILLLDEGDSLLGRRTEVQSANDRYANLETNYLLQKMEHYQGILIVTTNSNDNIDKSFQRRMDVMVHFVMPQAQERWEIWNRHLPPSHSIDPNFIEKVANRCSLSGGQIRNAALLAALLALDEGSDSANRRHVEEAVLAEYRKAGAICPLHRIEPTFSQDDELQLFLNSF